MDGNGGQNSSLQQGARIRVQELHREGKLIATLEEEDTLGAKGFIVGLIVIGPPTFHELDDQMVRPSPQEPGPAGSGPNILDLGVPHVIESNKGNALDTLAHITPTK